MAEIALVTGAGGTLGRELAERLSKAGYRLVLTGRDERKLIENRIADALCIPADLSEPDAVEKLFAAIEAEYAEPATMLAHCAGSVMIRPLHRTTVEQYRSCMQNNLDSAFFTLQGFVQALLKQKKPGRAVLISSIAARIGISNHAAVGAAKAAIEGLVRSVAATYASHGIRVNGLAPGLMRTSATEGFFAGEKAEQQIAGQYPLGRYGQAADAAGLIYWLLSNEAEWITGQIIAVDGGFSTIWPLAKR